MADADSDAVWWLSLDRYGGGADGPIQVIRLKLELIDRLIFEKSV